MRKPELTFQFNITNVKTCCKKCCGYFSGFVFKQTNWRSCIARWRESFPAGEDKLSFLRKAYRAIFLWPWKMVSVSARYLFYQPMDDKVETWTLRFPAKENPYMEKALFDRPIVLQYDVKANYWLISRKFSGMKFFHPSVRLTIQKPRAFVSVR